MGDRALGMVGIVLAIIYAIAALNIEESFISDPLGPKAFPLLIAALFGLAGLVMVLKPAQMPDWPQAAQLIEILLAAGVLYAYALILSFLGFSLSTFLASFYLSWRLGAQPLRAAIAGAVIAAGLYGLFHLILGLSLARGIVGF